MSKPGPRRDQPLPSLSGIAWLLHFVQLDPFPPAWKRLELDDDALRSLETQLMADPEKGPVIPGTGGVRKLRFAPPAWHTGRRGALRVYYAFFPAHRLVALIFAHSKEQAQAIPSSQKRVLRQLLVEIQTFLDSRPPSRHRTIA